MALTIILTQRVCLYNVSRLFSYNINKNICWLDGPKITKISSTSILIADQPLVLVCEAHGNPLPSYTWYHNGKNISLTSVYNKSNITTQDSGSYTCMVTNRVIGILMNDNKTTNVTVFSS